MTDTTVLSAAPIEAITPVKKVTRKRKSKVEAQVSEEAQVTAEEAQVTAEEAPVVVSLSERIAAALAFVSSTVKELKVIESELKTIKSLYQKEYSKQNKKPRKKSTSIHGFVKQVGISKALAKFLKVPEDTLISRPKVTHAISNYIKEHNLANPEKKSIFKTDSFLKKILGEPRFLIDKNKPELGDGFSYFNLQLYMRDHFMKSEPIVAA
jgi:chromatin remodeling complex protein RSC6